mgnify:CR=1 FL=1|tara:strand:- start:1006 stop:2340 length:1335 start_codon:yes stop_codon:yes gene_type:complete
MNENQPSNTGLADRYALFRVFKTFRTDQQGKAQMSSTIDVAIVGAGVAGIACARTLARNGVGVRIYESSSRVGGRLGSRLVDDIWCDLGFQVSMSNYTALESLVPRTQVTRRSFVPGAVVWDGRRHVRIVDPKASPLSALKPLMAGLVRPRDLLAVLRCRRWANKVLAGSGRDGTAAEVLSDAGFSSRFIEQFLRPFFGGVFLDESLSVPADRFLRTLHRFASGRAELPEGGMQQLAEAMSEPIRSSIEFECEVASIEPGAGVRCVDGAFKEADVVVLATPLDASLALLGRSDEAAAVGWSSTTALHFTSPDPVFDEPIIVLNGSGEGALNLICSPTSVAPGYRDDGRHSILVSSRPCPSGSPGIDADAARHEAGVMLGLDSSSWELIEVQRIDRALPIVDRRAVRQSIPAGVHLVGDGMGDPSIETAVQSGIDAARAIVDSPT